MTVARDHLDWLSLVETSGPFLSIPVLLRVFPQGLDKRDSDRAGRLREAYEDWLDRGATSAAVHQAWVRYVLTDLLEYPANLLAEGQAIPPGLEARLPQQGETLRPDLVLRHRDPGAKIQLLISVFSPTQDLSRPVPGRPWKASPGTRMMELLHASGLPLGLVTNGEQWMLVYAPRGETTGFASWYSDLWMQEPVTLRAFQSLLHLRRLIGVAESETLASLFAESAKDQQEVTDQLGKQVRQAVEVLVQAFDRIDAESQRTLLAGVDEKELYNAALTVMMRLVFLFSAEERELLPLNDRFYDEYYAASSLRALLRERADQHGEEVLERRYDAWSRLLSTFRAVHGGVQHDRLQLPAYGGSLFDPDRYPFLEGRAIATRWRAVPAKPLPINNRVVLHLLEALQELRVRVPGGPAEKRRISFRGLDIEQIGHVYEGLLDHTARRAGDVVLGLSGKHEPEVQLSKLEELSGTGSENLNEFLVEVTGRSAKALAKALQAQEVDEAALQQACSSDMRLVDRLRPFSALLRPDSFGQLVVVQPGCVYVTSGSDRRSTGTHYTPRSLTEPIVQHTLEPLVYAGPAEGLPPADWKLKSPKEILALKVCDLAMGSGAFLVQACRYLAERLVEAWERAEREHPGEVLVTPEGKLSAAQPLERLLPTDPAERLAIARRYVADRCLYGVDINPMAVEMAKLSLWLITLQRDRPFTFLDHALKCGDSLLGVSSVQQIENFSLRPGTRQFTFATANLFRFTEEASAKRRILEDLPSNDHTQIETKNRLHAESEGSITKVKALADALLALELRDLDGDAYEKQRLVEAEKVHLLMKSDLQASLKSQEPTINHLSAHIVEQLRGRRTFHWAVEFPEVFARGGFDSFIGNPPFQGGKKISATYGSDYREHLVRALACGRKGNADLAAYFFLRTRMLLRQEGSFGLIATNTICQGETREVGLDALVHEDGHLIRAIPSMVWPGTANVFISIVWYRRGQWLGQHYIGDDIVSGIEPDLTETAGSRGNPVSLESSSRIAFLGSNPRGAGFFLSPSEADAFIKADALNAECIEEFMIGEDLMNSPHQNPSRFIINFHELEEAEARKYPLLFKRCEDLVLPKRREIPHEKTREKCVRYFWRYDALAKTLYETIHGMNRVLATAQVSPTNAVTWIKNSGTFDKKVVVFAVADSYWFGLFQSSVFWEWVRKNTATLGGSTLNFSPSDCVETLPFPEKAVLRGLSRISDIYFNERRTILEQHDFGLTPLYKQFHDRADESQDFARLRALQVEMDQAVAVAYGWSDLDLGHGFHATKQGERYTINEPARRTILDRLLALNRERYADEVKAGLHEKGGKKSKADKASAAFGAASQKELFE